MSQKIFDNDLVAICKSKVTSTLKKSANVRMYILDVSNVLIYEFHYDCIKKKNMVKTQDYSSLTLVV